MSKAAPSVASDGPTVPVVDLERIETTYTELKKMEVVLDPNPIEYGPKRFNNRIAKVRAMLNRVEQIFLQTSEDLHYFQRVINARRTLYDLEKRELMVNDPRCRVGRSQQEREALADVQLRPQIEQIKELESDAHDLETLMIAIKSKRTDLKDVQGRMRDQMKLIEHDLSMGARWGMNAGPTSSSDSLRQIDDMLAVVDGGLRTKSADADDEDEDDQVEEETADETEEVEESAETDHDPQPRAEDPVVIFDDHEDDGEAEDDGDETSSAVEFLLGDADSDSDGKPLPSDHDQEEADDFLDALASSGEETEDSGGEEDDDDSGIDDLIASLADD